MFTALTLGVARTNASAPPVSLSIALWLNAVGGGPPLTLRSSASALVSPGAVPAYAMLALPPYLLVDTSVDGPGANYSIVIQAVS